MPNYNISVPAHSDGDTLAFLGGRMIAVGRGATGIVGPDYQTVIPRPAGAAFTQLGSGNWIGNTLALDLGVGGTSVWTRTAASEPGSYAIGHAGFPDVKLQMGVLVCIPGAIAVGSVAHIAHDDRIGQDFRITVPTDDLTNPRCLAFWMTMACPNGTNGLAVPDGFTLVASHSLAVGYMYLAQQTDTIGSEVVFSDQVMDSHQWAGMIWRYGDAP